MKHIPYRQNPTVIDTSKKARPPPGEISTHEYELYNHINTFFNSFASVCILQTGAFCCPQKNLKKVCCLSWQNFGASVEGSRKGNTNPPPGTKGGEKMNPAQFEWQTRCEFNAYYKEEGLPFVLDYDVWHRKDAAANGMFDDEASPENRDWRDEHDGIIADTIAGILFKALPAHTIPPKLRFSYENVPALDAEILSVYCGFEAAGLSFSLDFELNTGRGGNRVLLELEPEPSAGNVSLTCEGMDDDFTAAWNPDTAKWDKPLPAKQQGK